MHIQTLFKTSLGRLRIAGFAEGCSYLLFALTMPLKYVWQIPQPNYVLGMVHGILFVAYIALVIQVSMNRKWSLVKTGLALVASLVPFGTFYADKKLFRE